VSVSPQTAAALVILLVEDEFFVRTDISDFLREAGYVVVEAQTGEEAIAVFDSGMSIDAVFTDINLTGRVSGWDAAQCFRADRPNMPVLYTSGKIIEPGRKRREGADHQGDRAFRISLPVGDDERAGARARSLAVPPLQTFPARPYCTTQ
jgi:CheY-like chemotaxis protein